MAFVDLTPFWAACLPASASTGGHRGEQSIVDPEGRAGSHGQIHQPGHLQELHGTVHQRHCPRGTLLVGCCCWYSIFDSCLRTRECHSSLTYVQVCEKWKEACSRGTVFLLFFVMSRGLLCERRSPAAPRTRKYLRPSFSSTTETRRDKIGTFFSSDVAHTVHNVHITGGLKRLRVDPAACIYLFIRNRSGGALPYVRIHLDTSVLEYL